MKGEEGQFKEVKIKVENLTPATVSIEIKRQPLYVIVDEAGEISDKQWERFEQRAHDRRIQEDRDMGVFGFDEHNDDHYE